MKNRIKKSIGRAVRRKLRMRRGASEETRRPLSAEPLEGRMLLAADLQNPIDRYDVNVDHRVTAADLIAVLTDLGRNGSRSLLASSGRGAGEGEPGSSTSNGVPLMLDVNGDNMINSMDAIQLLKRLGEGAPGDPQAQFRIKVTNTAGTPVTNVSVGDIVLATVTVQDIRDPNDPRFPDLMGNPAKKGLIAAFLDVVYSLNASLVTNFFSNPTRTFNHIDPYTLLTSGDNAGTPYPLIGMGKVEDLGGIEKFEIDSQGNIVINPVGPGEFNLVQLALRVDSGNPKAVNDSFNVDENSVNQKLDVLMNDTVDGTLLLKGQFADGLSNQVQTFNAAGNNASTIVPESEILFPTVTIPINGVTKGGLTIVAGPTAAQGTATVNNNGTPNIGSDDFISFTPAPGFVGQVQIVYSMNDGKGTTATATATVNVGPVNDPPVNSVPGPQVVDEDTDLIFSQANGNRISTSDVDAGNGTVRMDLTVNNGTLTLSSTAGLSLVSGQGTASLRLEGTIAAINAALGAGNSNSLKYRPNADYNGPDTLTVTTNDLGNTGDGGPKTDIDTVAITVRAVNDAPVNSLPPQQFTDEGVSLVFSTANSNVISVSDVDAGTNNIEVKLTLTTQDVGGPGTFTLGSTSGITIVAGANGSSTMTIRGPQASIRNALLNATYTPAAGFIGDVSLKMETSDLGNSGSGGPLTDTDTLIITVDPIKRPRARRDTVTVAEGSSNNVINVLANDIANNVPGAKVTLVSFTQPAHGTVTRDDNGTPGDTTDDKLLYTPNPFFNSLPPNTTDTFTYTINDTTGLGTDDVGTVVVTVTEVNDAPTAVDDNITINEDAVTDFSTQLTGNDKKGSAADTADTESGQTLTIVGIGPSAATTGTSAQGGTLVLTNGVIRYTPPQFYNGPDSFTYTIEDNGTTNGVADPKRSTATVNLTILPVNNAPVPVSHSLTTQEDTPLVFNATTITDLDGRGGGPDEVGQTLTIIGFGPSASISATTGQGGTVSISGGVVTYTPKQDFFGTDTFTYTVEDNGQTAGVDDFKRAVGTVTVTVTPVNDPPIVVASSDIGVKNFTTEYQASKLLQNDKPGPDNESNQTLRISRVNATSAQGGTVQLIGQTIKYTPPQDYLGPDSITYFVQDNGQTQVGATLQDDFKETQSVLNLNVIDFIPSPISGFVYLDVDNNGVKGASERGVGGVRIDLIDMATNNVIDTVHTDATGAYQFTVFQPGTYKVKEHGPALIMDGKDTLGSAGGTAGDDEFTLTFALPGGVNASGYNFGERGLDAQYFSVHELLASSGMGNSESNSRHGLYVGNDGVSNDFWYVVLGGWQNLVRAQALSNLNKTSVNATITDSAGNHTRPLQVDNNRLRVLGNGAGRVVRFDGDADDFGFTLAAHQAGGEGEGAAGVQDVDAMRAELAAHDAESYRRDIDALMAAEDWA